MSRTRYSTTTADRSLSSSQDGKKSCLVDHNGRPLVKFMGGGSHYQNSLQAVGLAPQARASNPFEAHPWVASAANAIAKNAAAAPFLVWTETADDTKRYGKKRRSVARRPITRRFGAKGIEPNFDHPLMPVLNNPNPFLNGHQMMETTFLWLSVRGETFWVLTDAEGNWIGPGEVPEFMWPMSPDLFKPILEHGQYGMLIGWEFSPPRFMTNVRRLNVPLHSIIQFKFPDPKDPMRGRSPLAASAGAILMDLTADSYNYEITKGGGVPKGILHTDVMMDPEREREFQKEWREEFDGTQGSKKTALLSGGWKYTPVSMSPKDMEFLAQKGWNRDEILAAMGVPRTTLGITEFVNYATQLGQDKNFIEKTILPYWRAVEWAVDSQLFFLESDDNFFGFDLRNIEALRAGQSDKINMANIMSQPSLHVPPRVAYATVGLEVPEYEGDDLVTFGPTSFQTEPPPVEEPEEEEVEEEEETEEEKRLKSVDVDPLRWFEFVVLEEQQEQAFKGKYRSWVSQTRNETLSNFDKKASKQTGVDLAGIILDLQGAQNLLRDLSRPVYTDTMIKTFDFTAEEFGGITVFEIDDPTLQEFFELRETRFVQSTPVTLRNNLIKALEAGLKAGESLDQLRSRVAQVFDVASSSSKAITVARTEMASFMNGSRDRMFTAQGIVLDQWVTAGDEHVRDSHKLYGQAGPKERNFNYLSLSGAPGGKLFYPGDVDCTNAAEIVNCRCIKIPVQ